jgi:hypothetical protein
LIASLAKLALFDGSLRSLRCSLAAAVFVESDETSVWNSQLYSRRVSSASPADRRHEHRGRGSRFQAVAFLTLSPTKSMSARSLVQDSGARSGLASLGTQNRERRTVG